MPPISQSKIWELLKNSRYEKVRTGELSEDEYDDWRYNFFDEDLHRLRAKITPSPELSDLLVKQAKKMD